ncbi:unnamed protein product [Paramecium octaurelia]|uniref:Transmembrane protein n=1 Tax=Paramecium octaurelia TaxID=43137 RepID=A0A8S1TQI5_PAROT|nr:unnamed protein product [Paramecium octaurelia]
MVMIVKMLSNFILQIVWVFDIHFNLFLKDEDGFFENKFDFLYFNEIGLQQFILIIEFTWPEEFGYAEFESYLITNSFKEKVFSIQLVILKVTGELIPFNNNLYQIQNFDQAEIYNLLVLMEDCFFFEFQNRGKPIDYKILNTTFFSKQIRPIDINIQMDNLKSLIMHNVTILDATISNSIIFGINSSSQNGNILIEQLYFRNCIFNNTVLFKLKTEQKRIIIQDFFIEYCQFYNSSLFVFQQVGEFQTSIIIKSIVMKKSLLFNSQFIQSDLKTELFLYSFEYIENQITNSQIISFSADVSGFNFSLISNEIIESILFDQFFQNSLKFKIDIDEISLSSNVFQNFQVLVIDQQLQLYSIELKDMIFKDNINPQNFIQNHLFKLTSSNILIQNVMIINTINLRYIYLFNITKIIIKNVTVQNPRQEYMIPLFQECVINKQQHSQLLYVQGFQSLYLGFIKFLNQITIDYSAIEIFSNPLTLKEEQESILIQNITFIGNILMKINKGLILSIFSIYSEKTQYIQFENVFYQNNTYNQYIADPSQSSASLLFISSLQSTVILQNVECFENSLTNSSNTFIVINSKTTKIKSISVFHHNYLRKEFWNTYYKIQLQSNLNELEINYIITKTLGINNKGGVMSIIVDQFTLEDGLFQYLIAESSSVFDITTQGTGIIRMDGCNIAHVSSILYSDSEQDGSISINSKLSDLSLKLTNFIFSYIHNNFAPALFSISTSKFTNNIIIKNVQVLNCFSLINLFTSLVFTSEKAHLNKVTLENILIQQSYEALIDFNQQLPQLDSAILTKIPKDNAILNIVGCKLKMNDIVIEGIVLSSIFQLIDCQEISLKNILFYNIILFYSFNFLDIQQNEQFHSIIQIQNLTTQNLLFFNSKGLNCIQLIYPNFSVQQRICNTFNPLQQHIMMEPIQTECNNFEKLKESQTQNGSILSMKCRNNQTQFYLKSIHFINNDCKFCSNGLINFDVSDFKRVIIDEFLCFGNIIQQFGCLFAISEQQTQGRLHVYNSLFINNSGTQGIAMSSINVKTFLQNIRITNNVASSLGGGIFFDLNSIQFLIRSAFIQNNSAREGGGIYLNGNSILNKENFYDSLLILNNAQLSTNNLQELPSHLDLSINYQILPSKFKTINSIPTSTLNLHPYKILQQGKPMITQTLMIPSNQEMSKYTIYNQQKQNFISYLIEVSIQFKNQLNEQLLNFSNSTCQVVQSIINLHTKTVNQTNISLFYFDQMTNNFNLGTLILTQDPYKQYEEEHIIQLYCKTKYQTQELQYNIKTKSLFCQLGEFYVQNGCSVCQSLQGFYSVTYNTSKCSIFDKIKFDEITSNNIKLKPGYWRPHHESDIVVNCFKRFQSCQGGWIVGDDLCNTGYMGAICEECDKYNIRGDGYYFKNNENLSCLSCVDTSLNFLSFILLGIWSILLTLITLRSVEKTNQLFTSLKLSQRLPHLLFKFNLDQESILLKLYLNYTWIFSVIFKFNIQFSFSFIFINTMTDTSYFMSRNLDCQLIQQMFPELIYTRVIVMLTFIIFQIALIQFGVNIFFIVKKAKLQGNILSITLLYGYIQNYASLINQLSSIQAKRQISSINYVQGDVSLLLDSYNHQQWIYYFAIPLLSLIGLILPISLLCFMYIKRGVLNKIPLRRHISYLFNEYKMNCFYWEWMKLWKKTIIIIILIYFETNIFLKGILIGICLIFYQIITSFCQPYIYEKLNKLDLQTGQCCSIAIFFASVQYICQQEDENVIAKIVQMLIMLLFLRLSYPIMSNILVIYYRKYKVQVVQGLVAILRKSSLKQQLIWKLNDKLDKWKQKKDRVYRNFKKMKELTISKNCQESKMQANKQKPFLIIKKKK